MVHIKSFFLKKRNDLKSEFSKYHTRKWPLFHRAAGITCTAGESLIQKCFLTWVCRSLLRWSSKKVLEEEGQHCLTDATL